MPELPKHELPPDLVEAQRRHHELMERADQAVATAFRHAEEAATETRIPRLRRRYPQGSHGHS